MRSFTSSIICILFYFSVSGQTGTIPVEAFKNAIEDSSIQLLDVRTIGEFNNGHIANAFQADWTNTPQFTERIKSISKDKPVYIYCQSGARSSAAAAWLKEYGYTVYNLDGGIAAWRRNNLNVVTLQPVPEITLDALNTMIPTNKTVIVDVGAPWCPPCKKMEPVIDSLSLSNNIQVIKINGGEQTTLSNALSVQSFPTFIVYKNGNETWRKEGIVSATEIASHL